MNLKITDIRNHAKPTENLVISVTGDISKDDWFVLFDETYNADGSPSDKLRHTYLLGNISAKKGDWIVLFTGDGAPSSQTDASTGSTTYFRYWGLSEHVWNRTGDKAWLLKPAPGVDVFKIPEAK